MKQTDGRTLLSAILMAGLLAACSGPDQSPTVLLSTTQPAQDSRPLTLVATATSPASTPITKVEFFKGDTKLGEDTTSPYEQEVPINVDANTTLEFSAKATDQQNRSGKKTLSVPVTADTEAPSVSLNLSENTFSANGTLNLTATASDNIGVAKIEFYRDTTKLGEDTEAPYTLEVPITAALNGSNPFSAKAFDFKGLQSMSNPLSVGVDIDDVAPTISLNISSNNLNAVGSLILNATASDNKGIAKVEFYRVQSTLGTTKLGEDSTSPYTFEINYSESYNQTDSFTARAIDPSGNSTTSEAVSATIDIDIIPPTVNLAGSSTSFTTSGNLDLSATASDNVGVAKVEFYRGATKLGEDSQAPYGLSTPITSALNGTQNFSAKAYDLKGLHTTSEALSVGVDIDGVPPTVSLSASANSFNTVGTLTLNATASDNKGVAKVEFYRVITNTKLGEDTTAPYSFSVPYNGSYLGTDSLVAIAVDNDNNTATSNTVSIAIDIDVTPPNVVLAASSTSFSAPGTLTLTATASDNRAVSRVEFYRGSTLLATFNDAPFIYTLNITAPDNGLHNYTAKGFDARNNFGQDGKIVSVAMLPTISSFGSSRSSITSDGAAFALTWAATNQSGFTLSVDSTTGLGGMPTGALGPSAHIQNFVLSSNPTPYNRTYTFTLTANGYGGASAATQTLSLTQTPAFSKIAAGFDRSCALIGGQPYCWGRNTLGTSTSPVPTALGQGAIPSGVNLVHLSVETSACALASNAWAYCWGFNTYGSLGDGTTTTRSAPVAVSRGVIPTGVTLTRVSTRSTHTCAIGNNGAAYCWGGQFAGALGNGINSTAYALTPVAVSQGAIPSGTALSEISPGGGYTCALSASGAAYCWGSGLYGQLGMGSTGNSTVPVAVVQGARPSGVTYTKISAGNAHTCALGSNGWIYCWGRGTVLPLGDGVVADRTAPVSVSAANVPSDVAFTDVVVGGSQTCALGNDGRVYCWGKGLPAGANTSTATVSTPTMVLLGGIPSTVQINQISALGNHTCGIGTDKRAYCWGQNDASQLGRQTADTNLPGPVVSPVQ